MVIAVFMAVFAVGILYYALGTGEAILLREHLQDAADASALSGAVMHARGMNFLVLLNIVMAALLTVLVAIKALEGLAILGVALAIAAAWFSGGSTLALIPPLNAMRQTMRSSYDAVKPPVFEALEILHKTAGIVQEIVPGTAETIMMAEAGDHGVPTARGLPWTPRQDLPVQDDGFDTLCGKAGSYAADVVTAPLEPFVGPLPLGGVASDFTSSLSSWFCGDSGDPPPAATVSRVATYFPRTDKADACANDQTPVDPQDPNATTPLCEASRKEASDGAPDSQTGACKPSVDCAPTGAYERLAATALDQCAPGGDPRPVQYTYQQRKGAVPYEWTRAGWKRLSPVYQPMTKETADRPPCGRKEDHPSIAIGYNANVHPHGDVNDIVPICTNESAPAPPGRSPSFGDRVNVPVVEIVHILGCKKYTEQKGQVSGITPAKEDGGSKSPKMILSEATLGDQNFQIRSLVSTEPPVDPAQRVVRVSMWGAAVPAAELDAGHELGTVAVAQAEYFFDGADGRPEWLWQMNWRARLVRFRIPTGDGVMDECTGACTELVDALAKYGSLFVH